MPSLDAGVVGRHQRHVAVDAVLGLGRVVERAGAEAGDAARLPVVVLVEAADPAVVVDRLVEVDLVAGGAERRRVTPRKKGLMKVRRCGSGSIRTRKSWRPSSSAVVAGRQVVEGGDGDLVVAVAHGAADRGDHVAGGAGDAGLGLRGVDDLLDRRVHHARTGGAPGRGSRRTTSTT